MSTFITKIDKIGDPFVLLKDGVYYMYATSPADIAIFGLPKLNITKKPKNTLCTIRQEISKLTF